MDVIVIENDDVLHKWDNLSIKTQTAREKGTPGKGTQYKDINIKKVY